MKYQKGEFNMFKNLILAGCAIAMMSFGGLGTTETAEAANWRSPRTKRIYRRFRDARQDYRQASRRYDRYDRRWDNHNYNYNRYRGRYYRGNRGYNNGFVTTPYFSIGF